VVVVSESFDSLIARSELPRTEARLLLAHMLGKDKAWVVAHGDDLVTIEVSAHTQEVFAKRRAGVPIAHLVGEKEFFGRRFQVGPEVLIPRPETELLVELSVGVFEKCASAHNLPQDHGERLLTSIVGAHNHLTKASGHSFSTLDLGCGTGCIGLSILLEMERSNHPLSSLLLVDQSLKALENAALNAKLLTSETNLHRKIKFRQSDWFGNFTAHDQFDLIVSNPPYISLADPHLQNGDLRFEPSLALSSGARGMDALTAIIKGASDHLRQGGYLLLEHGYDQAQECRALMLEHGFTEVENHLDLAAVPRVCLGRRPDL
jgi:release factor glutamine methyltransferase